ncbi:MAG: hypothetical protein WDN27_01585 [Candidatus Saccharibacteria bacterium]
MIATAELGYENSPYTADPISARELGIDSDAIVRIERWTHPGAQTPEQAVAFFQEYGAVLIAPDFTLVEDGRQVHEAVTPVIAATQETIASNIHSPRVVKFKDFTAYNGTARKLATIDYPHVISHFPDIVAWQNTLLPTVRAISGDPTTEASIDPDEGTVINLQLFHAAGDPNERQQHGPHTDRVDITVVFGLDNVGPNGDLVFAHGYTEGCEKYGRNQHQNFNENIAYILNKDSNAIVFRSHPVKKGSLIMIKSAEDAHFITAKTLADVQQGIAEGAKPTIFRKFERDQNGKMILVEYEEGRGIVNTAFDTSDCRERDEIVKDIKRVLPPHIGPHNEAFYHIVRPLIQQRVTDPLQQKRVESDLVAGSSANDLYNDENIIDS